MATNAQLAAQIAELLSKWNDREAQLRDWLAGTPTGGPNSDGKYPLTDASGRTVMTECPALLSSTVTGPSASAEAAQGAAEDARDIAVSAKDAAAGHRADALTFRDQSLVNRDEAHMFRDDAAAFAAAAGSGSGAAEAARDAAIAARDEALPARDEAVAAQTQAMEAAAAALISRDEAADFAASINPATLATKAELQSEVEAIIGSAPGALDTLQELGAALGNDPNFATTMTNSLAGKAPLVHTHAPADITGLDTLLAGKAAVTHGHEMGDVTGLTAALADKAPLDHTHWLLSVLDTRNVVDVPQGHPSNAVAFDFKFNSSVGTPPVSASGSYSHIMTVAGWSANEGSGGWPTQWSFGDGLAFRQATSATAWGPWKQVWHSGNFDPAAKGGLSTGNTWSGYNTFTQPIIAKAAQGVMLASAAPYLSWASADTNTRYGYAQHTGGNLYIHNYSAGFIALRCSDNKALVVQSSGVTWNGNGLWHAGNFDPNTKATLYGTAKFGDIYASRGDGTGVVYLNGDVGSRYLYYNGSAYIMPGAGLELNGRSVLSELDARFKHSSSRASAAVTISTATPSGGADGDIWLKV